MGFNSSIIVLNDALEAIEKDTEFGKKIATAILELSVTKAPIDISSNGHVNAASVIETHHADNTSILAVGGNYVTILGVVGGYVHHTEERQIDILRQLAARHGYELHKKRISKF